MKQPMNAPTRLQDKQLQSPWNPCALSAAVLAIGLGLLGCAPEPPLTKEVHLAAGSALARLRVGAAAVSISPDEPEYLAGGLPYRRWLRIHDDIWARAIVLDDGTHRVAMVSVDLIGLYHDDVQRARAEIQRRLKVDYVLIAATHTHNAPDALGAWAPQLRIGPGVYRSQVVERIAVAVERAAAALTPVSLRYYHGPVGEPRLSRDTRPPNMVDDTLLVWQAIDAETGRPVATMVHFAAHPITVPAMNFDISSDFVHYLRQAIEQGGRDDDGPVAAQGGLCLFFNAALGGRITPATSGPLKSNPVRDLGYERAHGYGARLAGRALRLLKQAGEDIGHDIKLAVHAQPVKVRLENPLLLLGTRIGVFNRVLAGVEVRSEVAVIEVGPLAFVAIPGMLFPESVREGGAPAPGSDFPNATPERPLISEIAPNRKTIVVGLANDMLGYLIPRYLWDEKPPFTSTDGYAPYGELISPGPSAVGAVTEALARLRFARKSQAASTVRVDGFDRK